MSVELKIKSKHLSKEAQIIRFEERKIKRRARELRAEQKHETADLMMRTHKNLQNHRTWDVRNENRATYLARAYLAGKDYKSVEQSRKPENNYTFHVYIVPRIKSMVNKYGPNEVTTDDIVTWSTL